MIPILYESTETEFTSKGIARLYDAIRCEVTEERNGIYECELEYPLNGLFLEEIRCGKIIGVAHDQGGDIQPFDIYGFTKSMDGTVIFKCQHISYRQNRIVVITESTNSLNDALIQLKGGQPINPFHYLTNDVLQFSAITVPAFDGTPMNVRQLLGGVEGSILDTFRGEYEWNKWNVVLWSARGRQTDVSIRYGVNLTQCEEELDYSETYSSCIPFWRGQDDNNADIIVTGDLVSLNLATYNDRDGCIPLDLSDQFETRPTVEDLNSAALSYMNANHVNIPSQNINIDFEEEGFEDLQKCHLCDFVKVDFAEFGLVGNYKIVKVVWDVLSERYIEMELGNLSTTLSEALGISSSSGSSGSASANTIETGTITGASVSANSYKDYTVTFSKSFSSPPIVTASFQSTSTAGAFGRCTLGIVNTTTTGCTIRVFNGDSSGRAPNINWIAVGI